MAAAGSGNRVATTWSSIRRSAARGLAILGGLSLASSAATAYTEAQARKADKELPAEFVLQLDLSELSIAEAVSPNPLALLTADVRKIELRGVLRALSAAREDERVQGLLTVLGDREHFGGTAMIQELRSAFKDFRSAAKQRAPTMAFSTSFGEAGGNGMAQFYLASASEQVYMQRSGMLGLVGFSATEIFFRPLLDRLKVKPIFLAREEYKSFANRFKESGFTPPHREQTTKLLQDLSRQVLSDIALARGLEAGVGGRSQDVAGAGNDTNEPGTAFLLSLVDRSPLLAPAALDAGLLTGLKYRDELAGLFVKSSKFQAEEAARRARARASILPSPAKYDDTKPKKELKKVPIEVYLQLLDVKRAAELNREAGGMLGGTAFAGLGRMYAGTGMGPTGGAKKGQRKVAIVTSTGMILQGPVPPSQRGAASEIIDSNKLCKALEELREDPDVAAVVLRISSGGGSALASDSIHHALECLKASGKKLIVSMGDVAASGGYMMAAPADRILAQPATVTGSIGVIFGKFNIDPLLKEVGVNAESIEIGANASALSPFTDFTPEQLAAANVVIDDLYDDFISKVASGRTLPVEVVRGMAKGKVYTGRQALALGLVDQLGGLEDAIQAARTAANLPDSAPVYDYPPRRLPALLLWLSSLGSGPGESDPAPGAALGSPGDILSSAIASLCYALLATAVTAAAHGWGSIGHPLVGHDTSSSSVAAGGLLSAAAGSGGSARARQLGDAMQAIAAMNGTIMCYSPEAEALSHIL